MPPVRGLYAAAVPPIAAALLASSPHLQTGPTALTALLSFGALSALATPASPEYVQLGLLLAGPLLTELTLAGCSGEEPVVVTGHSGSKQKIKGAEEAEIQARRKRAGRGR